MLTILIATLPISFQAQEILYSNIEKELSDAQKKIIDDAILILQKASGNENNADAIDYKYRKKRNTSKWELKTWEAKEQRILAEKNYQKAYSMISEVYSSLINGSNYDNKLQKKQALNLDTEAKEQFDAANEILAGYQDLSKLPMANTNYDLLRNDLKKSHELKIYGLQNQIEALKIKREKVSKKIDQRDLVAWERAITENTVASYHEYLNNNPGGKYAAKANDRIRQLEKEAKTIAENNKSNTKYNPRRNNETSNTKTTQENKTTNNKSTSNNTSVSENTFSENKINPTVNNNNNNNTSNYSSGKNEELIFKVQIAASKTTISDWTLMHKAPNAELIEEYRSSTWIKYMVGSFKTYQEAATYRNKLKSTAPGAFIVVFEKGKQVAITEQMKQ